ncbi:MAG: Smr/MutS family protein [Chlorobiales bacterium]|nr:Smr/MutS family protein [Chlorobiales bacterium]
MARTGKKKRRAGPAKKTKPKAFHNPFQDQAKQLKKLVNKPPSNDQTQKPDSREPEDQVQEDERLFLQAMAGAVPLGSGPETAPILTKAEPPPVEDEELEVLAQLADLVSGAAPLDIRDTDEYVQGARPGLNPDIVHRLAMGRFPVQAHLDLHGLTLAQARQRVEGFLAESRRLGWRCILLIHGRGLSSPEGRPVLKPHLVGWLSRSGMRKHVLAFTSARPYDGGAGAVYVLLRK